MAREYLAHDLDQFLFLHRELRWAGFAPFLVRRDGCGGLGAFDQVLDLHFSLGLLVTALDDHARRAALVGIFELRPHLAGAEIKLGADAGVAERLHHALIVGEAILLKDSNDDGPGFSLRIALADVNQRRHQPGHADRNPRRGHLIIAEPTNHSIVTSAAGYRTEAHRSSLVVFDSERKFNFVHWARVVLETANNGRINPNPIGVACGRCQLRYLTKLADPLVRLIGSNKHRLR